ncbi:2-isopropylmalate synthase [Candidatus Poribacteria bacterium]|nr:2-isopropylmalate synthase [Candidatus Poribacteria bacterium]
MPRKIFIFDTTLRDGEQSPGASLDAAEKMEIAKQLAKLKVDAIEAGNPISSQEDFDAVSAIAREVEGPIICALARSVEKDVIQAGKAIEKAQKPMIHVYIGVSPIHMAGQLRKTPDQVMEMAISSVKLAKSICHEVEFSPMDAARAETEFLYEIVQATIEMGATAINIPDTVGYAVPDQFASLVKDIIKNVPAVNDVRLSIHCHDDLGMATSNSLAAVKAGANQIECTINGMGERAGNTPMEEVVMAIKTRKDYFDAYTDINTKEIINTSKLVSRLTGFIVPPNKPIVGRNAFAHSSGVHQDGILKSRETYEIMDPRDVGVQQSELILTSRSGRHALRHRLSELGYQLSDEQVERAYERFLKVADKKKEVFDQDLIAIVEDELPYVPQVYILEHIEINGGTGINPRAVIGLKKGDELFKEEETGDGPVDAAYRAIDKITGVKVELMDYNINAVTKGKDAMGEALIRIKDGDRIIIGHGASTDVIESSAKAYVNAINKMLHGK